MLHSATATLGKLIVGVVVFALAAGLRLPGCPDSSSSLNSTDIAACKQELQNVYSLRKCQGALGEHCCSRVEWVLEHGCHCWQGFTRRQRRHVEALLSECKRGGKLSRDAGVRLFVGVLTAGKNWRARQAIRATWGSDLRLHRVLFFSAKPRDEAAFDALRKEAAEKGDIVVLPIIWEDYYNITHQTLEVLRASSLDAAATHTLKVDDDSYVRVDAVLEKVEKAPKATMFMGFIENPGGGPHRNPSSQWYVPPEEWASEVYPPWAHGAGYVISQDLVREIAAGAALKPQSHQIFKLEDIAVGSWVEFVGKEKGWEINYVPDPAFNYMGCNAQDTVSHYIKPQNMRCMFKNSGACCSAASLSQMHLRGGGV